MSKEVALTSPEEEELVARLASGRVESESESADF